MVCCITQTAAKPAFIFDLGENGHADGHSVVIDGRGYMLDFAPAEYFSKTRDLHDSLTVRIKDCDGKRCGQISPAQKASDLKWFHFLKPTQPYTEVEFQDIRYAVYELNMGYEGTYYFVWRDDNTLVGGIYQSPYIDDGCFQLIACSDFTDMLDVLVLTAIRMVYMQSDPMEQGKRGWVNTPKRTTKTPALMSRVNLEYFDRFNLEKFYF